MKQEIEKGGVDKPARLSFSCFLDLRLNASDIDQTNINRDIRDGNWLSMTALLGIVAQMKDSMITCSTAHRVETVNNSNNSRYSVENG